MINVNGILSRILPAAGAAGVLKPNWQVFSNVQYGSHPLQHADMYMLNKGVCPCVVMIHGGGWSSGSEDAYAGRARLYALAGFHVVALSYRLATDADPTTHWPAQLEDVSSAVRWIRANAAEWRIDPQRIGVCGDSAGGHLSLFLGTTDEANTRCAAVVNMFGPCDLTQPDIRDVVKSIPLLGHAEYKDNVALYKGASPINQIYAGASPVMTIHGTKDKTVPLSQAYLLAARLHQYNIENELVTYDGDHGFQGISLLEQKSLELRGLAFMSKHLKPNPTYAV